MADARPRRLGLIIPWALFALLLIGWVSYWFILAHTVRTRLDAAIAAERASGAEVEVGDIRREGFPLQLAFELTDVRYAPRHEKFALATPRLVAHVNVLNPQHLILAFPVALDIVRSDTTSRITGAPLMASVRTENGALARISVEAQNLRIDDLTKPGNGLLAANALLHIRPDERRASAYQIALTAENVTLPSTVRSFEPLGQSIASLNAAIVLENATPLLNARQGDARRAWTEAGGGLRFEGLSIVWGPLRGAGEGRVTLDAARRLEGNLNLRLDEPSETLRALAASPNLSREASAAFALAAIAYGPAATAIDIPLVARNGHLFIGPAPVRTLDPLYD